MHFFSTFNETPIHGICSKFASSFGKSKYSTPNSFEFQSPSNFLFFLLYFFGEFNKLLFQSPATSARRPITSGGFGSSLKSISADSTQFAGTARSELSTNEVIRRLKDKINEPKKLRETAEVASLGEYNAFSRPRVSSVTVTKYSYILMI